MSINKCAMPVLVSLVAIGIAASFAATNTPNSEPPLKGKFVLVSQPGVMHSVHADARFETVGQTDFVVVPMQHTDTTVTYDYWTTLKDVAACRCSIRKKTLMIMLPGEINHARLRRIDSLLVLVEGSRYVSGEQACAPKSRSVL